MKIRPVFAFNISTDVFLVEAEQIVILMNKEEECIIRHFQSNGVDNPFVNWVLSRANLLLKKII